MDYNLSTSWTIVLIVAVVWDLAWRGVGLWRAAHNDQPAWFIAMLVVSSVGLLPIVYLLMQSHGQSVERSAA